MAAFLESFFLQYGYAAVFSVLIACGFGVPIPEDITLVTGGIISGLGYTDPHIMVAVGIAGVLAGDGLVFAAGRLWGGNIMRFRFIARVMTPQRYAQVEEKFEKYGNWVLFVARFLPGLRTPIYMTAGISRKVSVLRFILMDGLAALISVPLWVYLGDYGATNREWLMKTVHQVQHGLFAAIGIGAVLLGWFWWRTRSRRRFYREKLAESRARRKAAKAEKKAAKQNARQNTGQP
ncbi:TPA: DedA family protein [Neisseria bacilliformis]|uniref:DedA family protein n=1 Tax=Neisseria bacilliformis TaxID=267212 RepID=UPI000666D5E6|nr:DedA family protein [Neisseria bacilliformis]